MVKCIVDGELCPHDCLQRVLSDAFEKRRSHLVQTVSPTQSERALHEFEKRKKEWTAGAGAACRRLRQSARN